MTQCNVMLVDDHEIVREGLRKLIEDSNTFKLYGEAESAEQAFELCRNLQPDMVIVDLSLPGMGGIEMLRRLKKKWPNLKIMVFSVYRNAQLVRRAREAGALSFVSKSSDRSVIIEAINCTSQGKSFISPDLPGGTNSKSAVSSDSPLQCLSVKELEIFRLVSQGHSSEQIANAMFVSDKTVANNVSIIKRKLALSSTAELVHLAMQEGLLVNENPPAD